MSDSRSGETGTVGGPSPANRTSRWRIWLQAVRVFSFPASIVPILVASAFAARGGVFDPWLGFLMLVASVCCHAGANLANDYFDHRAGIDSPASLGPSKVIQQGLLTANEVRRGMLVAFGVATLLGLLIVLATGWPILLLAALCLGAAYFYTGGPRPLGYVALGEVTVFLSMGLAMVLGTYAVYAGRITLPVSLAAVAVASLVAAILHANNLRDTEPDRAAGKITLAALLDRPAADAEYAGLLVAAYLAVIVMVVTTPLLWPALLVGQSLPRAYGLIRTTYTARTPQQLNPVVRATATLHLRFGLLLSTGLLVTALTG